MELLRLQRELDVVVKTKDARLSALQAGLEALERRIEAFEWETGGEGAVTEEPPPLIQGAEAAEPAWEVAPALEPVFVAAPPVEMLQAVQVAQAPVERQPAEAFELQLGRVWLPRIGIAVLVTGLVLLGNFAYRNWIHDLPPLVRLAFLMTGAGALAGCGGWLRKRENTRAFGEVVLAGGLALAYWCAYAAHHVPRLRVIESPVAGAALVFGAAAAIAGFSLKLKSRAIGMMGLLLASYATLLQPLGWLSAVSNLALAGGGVALMLGAGWMGPGVVAMAGSYFSFFWWQMAGGAGGHAPDMASVWFLPPLWAVFAASTLLTPADHRAMNMKNRLSFAVGNHLAFAALFAWAWLAARGGDTLWAPAAGFGAILLGLSRAPQARGEMERWHLAAGVAFIVAALCLKLGGWQLAIGLALQASLLALAFRWKGQVLEAVLSAVCAGLGCLALLQHGFEGPVVMNAGVAGLVLAAAFWIGQGAAAREWPKETQEIRLLPAPVLVGGCLTLLFGVCLHAPVEWQAAAIAVAALAMTAVEELPIVRKALPFYGVLAVAFGVVAGVNGGIIFAQSHATFSGMALAAALIGGAHWLWERRRRHEGAAALQVRAGLGYSTLSFAMLVFAAIVSPPDRWNLLIPALNRTGSSFGDDVRVPLLAVTGLGIVLAARLVLRMPYLTMAGALLAGAAALGAQFLPAEGMPQLVIAACAIGVAAVLLPRSADELAEPALSRVRGLARMIGSLAWLGMCHKMLPESWGEVMALTGLMLGAPAIQKGWRDLYAEAAAFLGIGLSWFALQSATISWETGAMHAPLAGWATVVSLLSLGFMIKPASQESRQARNGLLLAGSACLTMWCSHLLAAGEGWKPMAMLWTGLGFTAVSVGLWRRLPALRKAGFALLAGAIAKLFLMDVWDFGAFMRVAAFLALGAALVVLAFFYNRFADVIRKLFESEREETKV